MRNYHRQDYLLAITVFLLVVFGLIMVASASLVQSYEVTGSNNFYLLRQSGLRYSDCLRGGFSLNWIIIFGVDLPLSLWGWEF